MCLQCCLELAMKSFDDSIVDGMIHCCSEVFTAKELKEAGPESGLKLSSTVSGDS